MTESPTTRNGLLKAILVIIASCLWNGVFAQAAAWKAGAVISEETLNTVGIDCFFSSEPLSDDVFRRMQGKSWKADCTLKRSELRYLRLLHRNAGGQAQCGEMVVNSRIAERVLRIFRQLFDLNYKIERIVLVDDYGADDERSMQANNTSAFNFRTIRGTKRVSKHGCGLAIDLNPRYNPCVKGNHIEPANGRAYAYRRDGRTFAYKIDHNDAAYKLFRKEGFSWGGDWKSSKDYQHFEYDLR